MASDGKVIISTELDNTGLQRGIKQVKGELGGLPKMLKSIGTAAVAAFSVKAIVDFGKAAIDLGSDIAEVQNVVDTAFGDMAYKAEAFADTAIETFGMSKLSAKKTASTYMAMARGMGMPAEAASDMAISLAGLTGDVASFYNISQELADVKLKSVFTGETESLKDLGVVMTQTNLQAFALSQGITKEISAMTQAEQVQLRYAFVTNQLSLASGDFAKTQDSWANQTRILSERWKEFMSIIGQTLITVLTPALKALNGFVQTLINIANAINNVMTSLFGGETKQLTQAGAAAESMQAAIGGSVQEQKALTDETKKTGKEAKKTMAGFDEINQLTTQTAQETGAGEVPGVGGSAAEGMIPVAAPDVDVEGVESKFQTLYDVLAVQMDRIKSLFSDGFSEAFGSFDVSSIMNAINSVGVGLKKIFTDPAVTEAAGTLFDSAVRSAGRLTGAVASIGLTIGQNLIGGFGNYLSGSGEYIKERLTSMFTSAAEALDITGIFAGTVADIFSVFRSEDAQTLTGNIIGIFSNAFLGVADLAWKWGTDILDAITAPINENKDKIKVALENTLAPLASVTGTISDGIKATFSTVMDAYDTYIGPAIDNIKEGLTSMLGTIVDAYNEHFAPVLDALAEKVDVVWKENIQPAIDAVVTGIGSIIHWVSEMWNTYFVPFFNWISENIVEYFSGVFQSAADTVIDAIAGICDFITGIFTGDLDKAMSGLIDVIKAPINGIISLLENALNWIIRSLNKLSFDIPDILGGGTFGFNFSEVKIPRLARGAVIPPNREFLAVLGDQSSGTNIEAPLSTIEQAVRNVMSEMGGTGGELTLIVKPAPGFTRYVTFEVDREHSRRGVKLVEGMA